MKTFKELVKQIVEDGEGGVPINNTVSVLPDKEPVVKKKDKLRYLKRNKPKS